MAWIQTSAKLPQLQIQAGLPFIVRCQVWDEEDRLLTAPNVQLLLKPSKGLQIKRIDTRSFRLHSFKTGTWEIACQARWKGQKLLDKTPLNLLVRPAAPARLTLQWPSKKTYLRTHQPLHLSWKIQDRWGNPIDSLTPSFRVIPNIGVTLRPPSTFLFSQERFYSIIASVGTLSTKVTVGVDASPPKILFLSPHPWPLRWHQPFLHIRGLVSDELSGVRSFTLNGRPIPLAASLLPLESSFRLFDLRVQLHVGPNLLLFRLQDRSGRRSIVRKKIFYFPPKWFYKAPPQPALLLSLSKRFLDDRQRPSLDDIASLLENFLNELDWDTLAPEELFKGRYFLKYNLKKRAPFFFGKRRIGFALSHGKISLLFEIQDIRLPLFMKVGIMKMRPLIQIRSMTFLATILLLFREGKPFLVVQEPVMKLRGLTITGIPLMKWFKKTFRKSINSHLKEILHRDLRRQIERQWDDFIAKGGVQFHSNFSFFSQKFFLSLRSTIRKWWVLPQRFFLSIGADLFLKKQRVAQNLFSCHFPSILSNPLPSRDDLIFQVSLAFLNRFFCQSWQGSLFDWDLTAFVKSSLARQHLPFTVEKIAIFSTMPPVFWPSFKKNNPFLFFSLNGLRFDLKIRYENRLYALSSLIDITFQMAFSFQAPRRFQFILKLKNFSLTFRRIQGIAPQEARLIAQFIGEMLRKLLPSLIREWQKHFKWQPNLVLPSNFKIPPKTWKKLLYPLKHALQFEIKRSFKTLLQRMKGTKIIIKRLSFDRRGFVVGIDLRAPR